MSTIDAQFSADATDRYAPYLNPLPVVGTMREYMRMVPPKDRSGRQMRFPIQAGISMGQTIDITGGAYTLNAARPGGELECILDGCDFAIRETFPYSFMLKARNGVSKDGDAAAYWDPLDKVMMSTMRGGEHFMELMTMWGPGSGSTILADIGVMAASPVVTGGPNWNSAGPTTVKLTQASWAPAIWTNQSNGGNSGPGGAGNPGGGGALLDVLNAAGTTVTATDVPVIGVADASKCQIIIGQAVTGGGAITAGERLIPKGWYQKAAVGVSGQLQNVGTFANINAANQVIWRARQYSAGGALTRKLIQQFAAKSFPNGVRKGWDVWVSSPTFAQLAEETSDPTKSGGQWFGPDDTETRTQGAVGLRYVSPSGALNIRVHEYMKQGFAFCTEKENSVRVGASDLTYRGAKGEDLLIDLQDKAGAEVRLLAQQAPLIKLPFRAAIITGIVNDGDDIPAN